MAEQKVVVIKSGLPTQQDTTSDTFTMFGLTMTGNLVMGDQSMTGVDTITFTDINGTISGIENQNLLDKSAAETISGAWTYSTDVTIYEPTNDGNPELRIGSADAEEFHVQAVYDTGAQTLDYVLFQSDAASASADKGKFTFNVDGTIIMDVVDAGITVTGDVSGTTIGGITEANLTDLSANEVITGNWDFGGATSLEIPNSATPAVTVAGHIAIDTTITDHTGMITYYDGTEALYAIGMPTANLINTDGYVVSYNATNNEFEMVAQGGTNYNVETYTNSNAGTIALGDVVYMTGTASEVDLADASLISASDVIVGIVEDGTILTTASGDIHVARGRTLAGVLTAATPGTIYYLAEQAGSPVSGSTLTTTAPAAPHAIVRIGFAKTATDLVFDPEFIVDQTS